MAVQLRYIRSCLGSRSSPNRVIDLIWTHSRLAKFGDTSRDEYEILLAECADQPKVLAQ